MKNMILLLVMLTGCHKNAVKTTPKNPVLGAWQVVSIEWKSNERTAAIEQAQAGMFIFNEQHYALMWSPKKTPRTAFVDLSDPTDEEILAGFKSIVFNAGSYQINNQQLVATAKVAKVPGFEGGQLFYRFRFENQQLILTLYDETYPDGSKPDWSGKWQTKFILEPATL
ncbi:lipocalin-like domain-containing protein [Marinicella litoralis]|uniref:Lipocalin-like protein n=1 Tax=Marinicella litoralis TaxID=644220 RepID=A0A4R6XUP8_9GAMM|nr:lipocalin-like domain-containing protein [Marinicella litoralis]TDR23732.1 lipocalin-like protein [Marinicella litoralis]